MGAAASQLRFTRPVAIVLIALAAISFGLHVAADYRHVRDLEQSLPAPEISPTSPTGYVHGMRHGMLLPQGADGYLWIVQTQQMLRDGQFRQRWTYFDNAPEGRAIHWSSGLMWWLAIVACIVHWSGGAPLPIAVESAAQFALPVLYLLCLIPLTWWSARRWGLLPTALLVASLLAVPAARDGWAAGSFDHHGAVMLAIVAGVLMLLWAHRPAEESLWPQRRRAAAWSGIWTGVALWISAATAVPAIIGICLGGMVALGIAPRDDRLSRSGPLWRIWGRSACLSSLAFYLLEYFPSHLELRLEVNSPLYALACLAAGEWLFRLATQVHARRLSPSPATLPVQAICIAIIAAVPALAFVAPQRFFWVADSFLLQLHTRYIGEFLPLLQQTAGGKALFTNWGNMAVLALTLVLVPASHAAAIRPAWRPVLPIGIISTGVFIIATFAQMRWMTGLEATLLPLATALLALLLDAPATQPRFLRATVVACLVLPILCTTPFMLAHVRYLRTGQLALDRLDLTQLAARNAAHTIRQQWQATGSPVILSGPNVSRMVGYWAGTQTIGTLYWENLPGLRTAAQLYTSTSPPQLLEEFKQRRITHVIMFSLDGFPLYSVELLGHPADAEQTVLFQTLKYPYRAPPWLRALPYQNPDFLGGQHFWLRVYQVEPAQR